MATGSIKGRDRSLGQPIARSRLVFRFVLFLAVLSSPLPPLGGNVQTTVAQNVDQPVTRITELASNPTLSASQFALTADDDELREIEDFDDDLNCQETSVHCLAENGNAVSKFHWHSVLSFSVVPFRLSAFPGRAPPLV